MLCMSASKKEVLLLGLRTSHWAVALQKNEIYIKVCQPVCQQDRSQPSSAGSWQQAVSVIIVLSQKQTIKMEACQGVHLVSSLAVLAVASVLVVAVALNYP